MCLLAMTIAMVHADELVMKSGERFTSDRIWEENGKIRFSMHGLLVSVGKEEVAQIIPAAGGSLNRSRSAKPSLSTDTRIEASNPSTITPPQASNTLNRQQTPYTNNSRSGSQSHRTFALPKRTEQGTGMESISWGMQPDAIEGLEKIKTEAIFGGIDQYWRPEQSLALGSAALDGFIYGFWQNQLYSIVAWVDGPIGYNRMRSEIFATFGPGGQNRPEVERYIWLEGETQRMLEFDQNLNTGIFVMRSAKLDHRIKQKYPAEREIP